METDNFYPPIDVKTIRNINLIKKIIVTNPSYFLESPYGGEIENFFKETCPKSLVALEDAPADISPFTTSLNKWDNLVAETAQALVGLKQVKLSTGDSGEQIAYYRTLTSLLEKLVSLQERALGLKQVSEFHSAVLGIMDKVLTPDQRTSVMEKLDEVISRGTV